MPLAFSSLIVITEKNHSHTMCYSNYPINGEFVQRLHELCSTRIKSGLLEEDWIKPQTDDEAVLQFMEYVEIRACSEAIQKVVTAKVKDAVSRFPKRFMNEVLNVCSSLRISIYFSARNELTRTERENGMQCYGPGVETGWAPFSNRLDICKQYYEADIETFSGILFHELAHLVLQKSKPETLFSDLQDEDLRDDECLFLGACLMCSETKLYLNFMTEQDLCPKEQLERDTKLVDVASDHYTKAYRN